MNDFIQFWAKSLLIVKFKLDAFELANLLEHDFLPCVERLIMFQKDWSFYGFLVIHGFFFMRLMKFGKIVEKPWLFYQLLEVYLSFFVQIFVKDNLLRVFVGQNII